MKQAEPPPQPVTGVTDEDDSPYEVPADVDTGECHGGVDQRRRLQHPARLGAEADGIDESGMD